MKIEEWQLGIIISASYIAGVWREPTMAAGLLNEHKITKELIKLADDYDKKILLPLFKSESILCNKQSINKNQKKVNLINESNKIQDEEYEIATRTLNNNYYLVCIDCGFKVESTEKLPKYNEHECPGKLQHTFRAYKKGDEP